MLHRQPILALAFAVAVTGPLGAADDLNLVLRDRVPSPADPNRYERRERAERWDAAKTAVIVCDMWDLHHCKRAVGRVNEMAPRLNEFLKAARDKGALVIHAPSS